MQPLMEGLLVADELGMDFIQGLFKEGCRIGLGLGDVLGF